MTPRLAIAALLTTAAPVAAQVAPAPAAATPAPAAATPAPAATTPESAPAPTRPTRRDPRVIEIDDVVVQGEVQRPEAFYVLQRSPLDFKGREPARSFIPLVIESVDEEPF